MCGEDREARPRHADPCTPPHEASIRFARLREDALATRSPIILTVIRMYDTIPTSSREALMKILKWILIVVGALVLVLIIAAAILKPRFDRMVETIEQVEIGKIDLGQIEDGVYAGEFGEFLVHVALEVTVKDHMITDITITEQRSGPGYEAHEMIERIIRAQSLDVDAVTGATGSSTCIKIAVQNALQNP